MRIIKVKNNTANTVNWVGATIEPGAYYQLAESEYAKWSSDSVIMGLVSSGNCVINDTTLDLNPINGWNWLIGNTEPPKSVDGDWHILNENFAHVTGNSGINWAIEMYLEPGTVYTEMLVPPTNREVTLNYIEGGSYEVPSLIKLEWFVKEDDGSFRRHNPWIRIDEIPTMKTIGLHGNLDNVINIDTSFDVSTLSFELYYGFILPDGSYAHRKITSVNTTNNQITLESPLNIVIPTGTLIGTTDRVIGQRANLIGSSSLNWISPPNDFIGGNDSHFKLTLSNEDDSNGSLLTASVNGWHTDI